jgi:hypothetical protein
MPGLAERMLVAPIREGWSAAVGPELARLSCPLDLERGTLAVGAETSASLQEIALRSREIVDILASRFGPSVTAIRPVLRPRPADGAAPAARESSGEAALGPADAERIDQLAATIADPAVAFALRRVLVKDHLARRTAGARPHLPPPLRSPAPPA